jgi:hypothetical protein
VSMGSGSRTGWKASSGLTPLVDGMGGASRTGARRPAGPPRRLRRTAQAAKARSTTFQTGKTATTRLRRCRAFPIVTGWPSAKLSMNV